MKINTPSAYCITKWATSRPTLWQQTTCCKIPFSHTISRVLFARILGLTLWLSRKNTTWHWSKSISNKDVIWMMNWQSVCLFTLIEQAQRSFLLIFYSQMYNTMYKKWPKKRLTWKTLKSAGQMTYFLLKPSLKT